MLTDAMKWALPSQKKWLVVISGKYISGYGCWVINTTGKNVNEHRQKVCSNVLYLGKCHRYIDVSCPGIHLRGVVVDKGGVSASFGFLQNINLSSMNKRALVNKTNTIRPAHSKSDMKTYSVHKEKRVTN